MQPLFADRRDAGRKLAESLLRFANQEPVILGMARGGVVLGGEVGRALKAPLDVLVVRKIGAPRNLEYGVGAVAPLDVEVIDRAALGSLRLTEEDLRPTIERELQEIQRRLEAYRAGMPPLDLHEKTAILVDDGLATGITALAAARYARKLGAARVIFAAPVCSRPGASLLEDEVDEVACLHRPDVFFAVGTWYDDFTQTEDDEVLRILAAARSGGYLG